MNAPVTKPRRVLAVEDAGENSIALESALALAEAHGASLEVIACLEPPHDLSVLSRLYGEDPETLVAETVEHMRGIVAGKLAKIVPDRQIDVAVSVGKAYLEVIRRVAAADCDLVVKKAEPLSGVGRLLFASDDQHLLRKCPCPVWLQTTTAPKRPRRVLAAVDLDLSDAEEPQTLADLNRRVIAAACMIARAPGAEVFVLHAWDAIGEGMIAAFAGGRDARISADEYVGEILNARQEAMDRFLGQVRREFDPRFRFVPRLARGSPETVIHAQRMEIAADAVVMGTVARTGLSGVFIGNTAENIINCLDCSVLAVKPAGFASPLLQR
ncbi:MAG: universal stress protein [Pseudomonadota bacterium]